MNQQSDKFILVRCTGAKEFCKTLETYEEKGYSMQGDWKTWEERGISHFQALLRKDNYYTAHELKELVESMSEEMSELEETPW